MNKWKEFSNYNLDRSEIFYFIPPNCPNPLNTGQSCHVSIKSCNLLQPCLNKGNCIHKRNHSDGYSCLCKDGFIGNECQRSIELCQDKTCLNNGKR